MKYNQNIKVDPLIVNKAGCCDGCGPISINAEIVGNAKRQTHDGVEMLIFPVVAIVEGVLNNKLVTKEEFGKFVHAWEGRPIPVNHPQVNGIHVSANIPEVREATVIGSFQRVEVEANKLKGEIWIDIERAKRKGFEDVVKTLEANQKMEVSTAYFADTVDKAGQYNGVPYSGVHTNLRPDHLALLPNDTGACSLENGCGVNANQNGLLVNFINEFKKIFSNREAGDMLTKDQKVAKIIAHKGNNFAKEDEDFLKTMDEKQLDKLIPNAESEDDDEAAKKAKEEADKKKKMDANKAEDGTASLSENDKLALNWARSRYDQERTALITKLTANKSCTFSKERLEAMSVDDLENIASMLGADYSGRGMPMSTHGVVDDEKPLETEPFAMASFNKADDKGENKANG